MWPVSADFIRAISGDHDVATKVEVLYGGEVVKTLTTLVEGSVQVSRTAIRRTCTLTFVDLGEGDPDGTLTPAEATDLLIPKGIEVRPWRGVNYPDGSQELVPLGTMLVLKVLGDYPTVTLEAVDRAFYVQKYRFERPYQILKGTNYGTAIEELVFDRVPGWVSGDIDFSSIVDDTTPLMNFDQAEDPWEQAQTMAVSVGRQLFFDQLGTPQLWAEQDPTTSDPVFSYVEQPVAEGEEPEPGRLIRVKPILDATESFNVVVANGENSSTNFQFGAARAVAVDDDPASVTYAGEDTPSAFGRRNFFHTSPLYTSSDQAQRGADTILQSQLGIAYLLSFEGLPNPAHEVGDVVAVKRAAARVDAAFALDSFPISMRAGGSGDVVARERRVIL